MRRFASTHGKAFLALLLSTALLTACSMAAGRDTIFSPTLPVTSVAALTAAPTATASPPITPSPIPAVTSLPTPPSPSLRIDFPLALDNTWVFEATRYVGYPPPDVMTTTLVITETVVEVQNASDALIARIHGESSAEVPVAVPESWKGRR